MHGTVPVQASTSSWFGDSNAVSNVLGCVLGDGFGSQEGQRPLFLPSCLSFGVRLIVLTADHTHLPVVALFSDTGRTYLTCTSKIITCDLFIGCRLQ
jgi:hypothetical protein